MKKYLGSFLLAATLLAAPSNAALYMKSRVQGGADDRPKEAVEMTFEGWFDGDRAVINILESNNSVYGQGKIYIDGTTMTLYDPEENTCTPWDLQAMLRFAGEVMESMSGVLQLEFGEPEVEILERKSGGTVLGRRVEYLKYRSDWTMSFKVPLMKKRTYDNSTVQEIWYDQRLRDELPAFGTFMDPDAYTTGYEEMDKAIATGMPPVEGAVLKSIAVSTMTNQKGKVETSTSISEVTELDTTAADPAGGYTAPADCQVVTTFPPTAPPPGDGDESNAEESDEGRPFSGLKVRSPFKRKKKKDDG